MTEKGDLLAPIGHQDHYLYDIAQSMRELVALVTLQTISPPRTPEGTVQLREPAKPKPRTRDELQAADRALQLEAEQADAEGAADSLNRAKAKAKGG